MTTTHTRPTLSTDPYTELYAFYYARYYYGGGGRTLHTIYATNRENAELTLGDIDEDAGTHQSYIYYEGKEPTASLDYTAAVIEVEASNKALAERDAQAT